MLVNQDAAGRPTYKSVHETALPHVYRQALALQSRLFHRLIPLFSFGSMAISSVTATARRRRIHCCET